MRRVTDSDIEVRGMPRDSRSACAWRAPSLLFHLAIGPGMLDLGQPMFDPVLLAAHVEASPGSRQHESASIGGISGTAPSPAVQVAIQARGRSQAGMMN